MEVRVDDLLPDEAAELRAVIQEYAGLHAGFEALEARRAAVEVETMGLVGRLEAARNREAALKRGLSERFGAEVELVLPA